MIKVLAAAGAAVTALPLLVILLVAVGPNDPAGSAGSLTGDPITQGRAEIPADYLAWYIAAAGTCPGLPWAVLAGIGKVESDHGRSHLPGVHAGANFAGAEGPMQFLPGTFVEFAVNADPGQPLSPYDPADAIYTAARMLCADGARDGSTAGIERGIFAYNHAGWYVTEVMSWADTYATQDASGPAVPTPLHSPQGDIVMNCGSGAPPLPPPLPPIVAARAVSEAARAVAFDWTRPPDLAGFSRALSQLRSILRDLGIATRGLARFKLAGHPADPAPLDLAQSLEASAQRLLGVEVSLDDVVVAEGLGPVPDPGEPGAMLCSAARIAITAWRQPSGTSAERDATIEQLVNAVDFLAAATMSLVEYAPRRRAIDLRAVATSLNEVAACLSTAIPPARETNSPRPRKGSG